MTTCPGGDACYIIERNGSRKPKHCTTCHRDWVNGNHPLGTDCLMSPEALRKQSRINDAYAITPEVLAEEWLFSRWAGYGDEIRASLTELIRTAQTEAVWSDKPDEWSEKIREAFPTRSGSHEQYGIAMTMVSNRHSKGALVALVNWLLVRADGVKALPTVCIECGKPCEYKAPDGTWTCFQCRYRAKPALITKKDERCPSCNMPGGTMHKSDCPEAK